LNNNDTTGSNHDEEKNLNNEHTKTEKSKKNSSIGADVLKGTQLRLHPKLKWMN